MSSHHAYEAHDGDQGADDDDQDQRNVDHWSAAEHRTTLPRF
jgi:hypothetical protein